MSLIQEQSKFRQDVAKLSAKIDELGLMATFGEAWRTDIQAWMNSLPGGSEVVAIYPDKSMHRWTQTVGGVGVKTSNHLRRLAVDFNFFDAKTGELVTARERLAPLGEFWESLDAKNRWGGNFKNRSGDVYHFERNV